MPVEEISIRTPLYGHTLDSLCQELLSGRAVYLENGEEYKLSSDSTRAIFAWYMENKDKWAGRNMAADVEKMVDRLRKRPPTGNVRARQAAQRQKRCVHLSKIRAHRFAGIHKYGSLSEVPPDFEYCFEKPITLIEGKNASGKTSLLNAIVWCLTGYVYRSQREPEKVDEEIEIRAMPEDSTEPVCKTCLPITPVAGAETIRVLGDRAVPLDTWVELTFVDDEGNEAGTIKRAASRTPGGKIKIGVVGIESLGVDPVALDIGTRVAGLIPYIQLEEASDLGHAIAALTPLRPLEDLVKHVRKSREKLKGELKRAKEGEIERFDREYATKYSELKTLIETSPGISIALNVPQQGADKTAGRFLRKMRTDLEVLEAGAMGDCKRILGEGFDPQGADNRKDLSDNVGKALGLLESAYLRGLASAQRLTALKNLTEEEMQAAKTLVGTLLSQGREIEELARSPERAVRERLYARVGSWIRQNQADTHACPVCQEELGSRCDGVTGRRIIDHLEEHAKEDKEYLARAIHEWARSCRDKLKAELPACLSSEMEKDLPERPADLIAKALGDELFQPIVFNRSLAPLRDRAGKLCNDVLATLPQYQEPAPSSCSDYLRANCGDLCKAIARLNRALAFARWSRENDEGCKQAFVCIIGGETGNSESGITQEDISDSTPLSDCLHALDRLNKNAAPLREAQLKAKALRETVKDRRGAERSITLYARAEGAIDELLELDKLVELQVTSLMRKLSGDVKGWREKLYCVGRVGIPEVTGAGIGANGCLLVEAEVGGTRASARHISNASDLRATLLAVLISFWKYLIQERGGLSLILLDDLQELFDKPNRDRMATSMREIAEAGGRLIVTTNDPVFGRQIAISCAGLLDGKGLDRRQIHPLKAIRSCIQLGKFREEIDVKRAEFETPENENEDQPARDYIKDLRIYIENRLLDFFDTGYPHLPPHPMMSDLMNALRRWRGDGQEPFVSHVFCRLLDAPALRPASQFVDLMNKSHHGRESEITFNEVYRLRSDCVHIRDLIDAAHREYELWLRRVPRPSISDRPTAPNAIQTLIFDVPLFENLAAATSESGLSEAGDGYETLSNECLGDCGVYLINTDNLGFSAPKNSRAIVSLTEGPIHDNSLVIALHGNRVYARRILRHESSPEVIALSSESTNPMRRIPSLLLPAAEVRLLQIIGILFDERPHWPREGEAVLLDTYELPRQITTAFIVRGESALPLALPGQKVLGANRVLPIQLEENKGNLVAVAFSGQEAFKRIGESLPGLPRLRVFESIGGLGDSIVIRTERIDNDPFEEVPLFEMAYRIVGVLYDST